MILTAALIPCAEGGFTVLCEEIPGAISQGETEAEALENLQEAVQMVLEANRELVDQGFHFSLCLPTT